MGDLYEVVCPNCKIGFAPNTRICPICNIPLISKIHEQRAGSEPIIVKDALSSLQKLRTEGVNWIHHLQERLAEAGIPYRTELSDSRRRLFSVYVRSEDVVRAREVDDEVFQDEVPESEGIPPVQDIDFSVCPGCGKELAEYELKCSSCGLDLSPSKEWRCKHCNGVLEPAVTNCPHCGSDIDWSKM